MVETDDSVRAWFEAFGSQAVTLASPDEVYAGPRNDDYVQATYADRFRMGTPEVDDELPFPCGEVLRTEATLSVTVDGGSVEGRVRRTEYFYIATNFSACAGRLACVRNIAVEGNRE